MDRDGVVLTMQDFASEVRALRKARGLSQQATAQLLGVSSVTVWNWENGRSMPWPKDRADTLLKLQEPRSTGRIPALAAPYGSESAEIKQARQVRDLYRSTYPAVTQLWNSYKRRKRLIDNVRETEP